MQGGGVGWERTGELGDRVEDDRKNEITAGGEKKCPFQPFISVIKLIMGRVCDQKEMFNGIQMLFSPSSFFLRVNEVAQ